MLEEGNVLSLAWLQQLLKGFSLWQWLAVVLMGAGVGLSSWGGYQWWRYSQILDTNFVAEKPLEQSIVVAVTGAVKRPGIVTLHSDSRWADALAGVGGALESADLAYVNQDINLAEKISDGAQLYIPFRQEQVKEEENEPPVATGISLNEASVSQLQELPGIGEKRADDIVAGRPYRQLTELVEKDIISEKMYEEIKKLVVL